LKYKSQRKICGFTRDKILNFKNAIRYILTEWKQQKKSSLMSLMKQRKKMWKKYYSLKDMESQRIDSL
jgi:hypothetical protein